MSPSFSTSRPSTPVSSRTSRIAVSAADSPSSMWPFGRAQMRSFPRGRIAATIDRPRIVRTSTPPAENSRSTVRFYQAEAELVSPPVALAVHVFAWILAEIRRANDEQLEALRPGLIASPGAGRDAHRVPLPHLDDLVVEFHPPTPPHHHVDLLLRPVRVAVGKAVAGWDLLMGQAGLLELERLGRRPELQVWRAVEHG